MRKCTFTDSHWNHALQEGVFHRWGTKISNGGPITVAIVEDSEGFINLVDPMDIIFKKKKATTNK